MNVRPGRKQPATHASASDGAQRLPSLTALSVEFYRQIVDGMTCGILTVNREGLITTLNEHAKAILELDAPDVIGRPCEEVLNHCPRLAQLMLDSFTMSSPPSRAEMEIRTRDQRGRTIGFSISRIGPSQAGAILGAALFFKDLTKVEEQEERERLRDRLVALGEMAAQMAHEIRNPLTSIQVSASLMKRRLAARGDSTDFLEKIMTEVARIESTVASCLEYARPLTPSLQETEPIALLEEAILMARLRAGSERVAVERAWNPGLPLLLCDRHLVKESLINILVNAYEAMGGRGVITIGAETTLSHAHGEATAGGRIPGLRPPGDRVLADRAQPPEQFLILRLTDTGPGITPEVRDKIFHPFFTTKTSGSGIGLAMARKVIESHGGWLDVESETGRGTTFILKIPVAVGHASGDAA